MYAKLKDKTTIQIAGNPIRIVISNPTDEQYRFAGYKPVVETPQPEYDPETQFVTPVYTETNESILQEWEIHEIESEVIE